MELLGVIRNLAKSGVGVVLITHKLHEVMAVADRVVVLRGGKSGRGGRGRGGRGRGANATVS